MRENSELRMLLKNNQCFILALTAFFLAGAAGAQSDCLRSAAVRNRPRFDRSQLQIGAYGLDTYARTEQHVRDIRDCGVNFIIAGVDRPTLDLFQKYGIGSFLVWQTPWWSSGAGKPGKMAETNPLSKYEEAARRWKDHPAVWAVDIGDEPSALDFEHYGKVVAHTLKSYPNQIPYLNLFPNYAMPGKDGEDLSKTQLGSRSYREHIESYCRQVPLDYISYDHYPWGWANTFPKMFENLRIVADACQGTGRSLWCVLQCNSHEGSLRRTAPMTENTMRYQAFAALSYGAEVITWGCWTKGWWEWNVLDTNGVKTVVYDRLKAVNAELHRFGPEYMRHRRMFTDLVGFPADYASAGQPILRESNGPAFAGVRTRDGSAISVGHFTRRDGSGGYAIFVAACDDPDDRGGTEHTLLFRVAGKDRRVVALGRKGPALVRDLGQGEYAVDIRSNEGLLVTAEDSAPSLRAADVRPFAGGERVVFLGDSITHGGRYHVDLQLYWDLRHPGSGVRLMNCGVGGDTVASGLERWTWDVLPARADRTFVFFGGNDIGRDDYGAAQPDAARLSRRAAHVARFETDLAKLASCVRAAGQKLVFMTPTPLDEYGTNYTCAGIQGCNETGLSACSAIVRKIAAREQAELVDLHRPLTAFLRRQPKAYCFCNPGDRVHPLDDGHLIVMAEILKAMGEPAEFAGLDLDAGGRSALEVPYAPKALPFPVSEAYRKADAVYPLTESVNREILTVRNLPPGRYALSAGGTPLGEFTDVDFVAGVNLAVLPTPSAARAQEALKAANELRFAVLTLRDMVFLEKRAVAEGAKAKDFADICAKLDAVVVQMKADKLPWADYYAQIVTAYHANKPREGEFRRREETARRKMAELGGKPLSYALKVERIGR